MTRDGPVILHIENAGGLDECVRDALLTLLTATDSVTLTVEDKTISTHLDALSVVFSDTASPEAFARSATSPVVFRRVFDASFDLTETALYDSEAEQTVLIEDIGLPADVAYGFVRVATATRDTEKLVSLPFSALAKWANLAVAYAGAGIDSPVHQAAENAVILVYADNEDDRASIDDLIKSQVPPTLDGWD
jgi:hypothetical protein